MNARNERHSGSVTSARVAHRTVKIDGLDIFHREARPKDAPVVKRLQKRLGKKLRFVFGNFPLTQLHPHALIAAEAAEAVADALDVGALLGAKISINEFLAYIDLASLHGQISDRSYIIATYALCGFANFSSIAIQIGGISALVPERRPDLARYGLRAMIAGALASWQTAAIAGFLIS